MNIDDFGKMALQRYSETVDQYNTLVGKTKAIESREKFQEAFMAEAPELAEFNDAIERLESELESIKIRRLLAGEPLVEPAYQNALASVGVDPEAVKELRKQIAAAAKFLSVSYGDAVLEGTPKPDAMRTAGGVSTGSGGRRIRGFDIEIDGKLAAIKNKDGILKSTFSAAAKELEVETTELQRAFFEQAKSEDVKADNFPALVEFEFKGKTITVTKVDDSDDSE